MASYIITNPTSKFGHDFVQRDENGNETFRKEITSKTTDGYYHLPVIVNGRKLCKISHIGDAEEFCLDTLPEKSARITTTKTSTKTPKIDLSGYYTDEEKAQLEKLQAKIDRINEAATERAQKDLKMKELSETLKNLDTETLKALMATIEAKA